MAFTSRDGHGRRSADVFAGGQHGHHGVVAMRLAVYSGFIWLWVKTLVPGWYPKIVG